jgi:hypothetical protein
VHVALVRRVLAWSTALVLAVGLVAHASPAQAVPERDFNVQTKRNGNGSAKVSGTIYWEGPRRALTHYTIDDLCPGDGQGAEMQFLAQFRYGRVATKKAYNDGCRDDPYVGLLSAQKPGAGRLRFIRIVACEVTYTQTGKQYGACRAKRWSNPRG